MSDIQEVVAKNVQALIDYDRDHGGRCPHGKALALAAGLTPSTVGRILSREMSPTIGVLEKIARVYHLQAYSLLVPNMDPANPPVVPYSDTERAFYWQVKALASAMRKTGEIEVDDERTTPPADGTGASPAGDHQGTKRRATAHQQQHKAKRAKN